MKKVLFVMVAVAALTMSSCCNNKKCNEATCEQADTCCAVVDSCCAADSCCVADSCTKVCE